MTEDENPNGSMWVLYAGVMAIVLFGAVLGVILGYAQIAVGV